MIENVEFDDEGNLLELCTVCRRPVKNDDKHVLRYEAKREGRFGQRYAVRALYGVCGECTRRALETEKNRLEAGQ